MYHDKLVRANRLLFCSILALTLILSGCSGIGAQDESALSPQQRALRAQSREWNQTVATGVLAGAAVGVLVGYGVDRLSGGRGGLGAAAGGLIGAVAGGGLGTKVANTNGAQQGRAQTAQERLASAQAATRQLEETADTAERTTADNRRRLTELDRQYRQGQVTATQYRTEASTMRDDVSEMRKVTSNADKAREELVQGGRSPALVAEDRKMGEARAKLSQAADDLDAALRRVPAA